MSETITFHALDLAGETGLKLYLRKNDGSLLNTGGDAFTEIGSSGVFAATLAESRVGLGTLHARVCDGTETADNLVYDDFLPESSTVIGAKRDAVLDSAYSDQFDAIEAAVDANTGYLTGLTSSLSALAAKFSGITLLGDWLRRAFRKDVGTAGMATAESEIQTGGTATFSGTTDNLEAIKDASGGSGGGSATVENQTTIINHLTDIKGSGWSSASDTLKKIRDAISNVVANLVVVPGPVLTPVGMPATLEIGDSYEEDSSLIIYIRDENDDPVSAAVGHDFTDEDFAPTFVIAPTPGSPRGRVKGIVNYVVPGGSDEPYLKVDIPSSQSKLAVAGEASVQLVLKWTGAEKTLLNTTVLWLPRI